MGKSSSHVIPPSRFPYTTMQFKDYPLGTDKYDMPLVSTRPTQQEESLALRTFLNTQLEQGTVDLPLSPFLSIALPSMQPIPYSLIFSIPGTAHRPEELVAPIKDRLNNTV